MPLLKIIYTSGERETLHSKSLEKATNVIKRRNVPNIAQATFDGEKIDLEPLKKPYGKPHNFMWNKGFNIFKIQAEYSKPMQKRLAVKVDGGLY